MLTVAELEALGPAAARVTADGLAGELFAGLSDADRTTFATCWPPSFACCRGEPSFRAAR
jgi:hypothetical protein